jgi:hypothetical protein
MNQPEQQLYVICWNEVINPVTVVPHQEYVHAESCAHARAIFFQMYPNRARQQLVAAGLALGHFCNEHGEGKTADVVQQHVIC